MAIQLDFTNSQYGVPFANAYFRIATALVTRTRDETNRFHVIIDIVGYATQPPNEDTKNVDFRRYVANLSDVEAQPENEFLAKCYSWVMSQPDMAGSVGV
jgi:hypothetical protein